jgi:hypothetical protein
MKSVKIIAREVSQDKNGKNYAKLTVETSGKKRIIDEETGEQILVNLPSRSTSVLAWEKNYLDEKPDFGWNLKVGERVAGDIVTRTVVPYEIPVDGDDSRTVNTYSCFVPGDTDERASFDAAIVRAFTRAGREIMNEDGTVVNPISLKSNTSLKVSKEAVASDFDE